jgi:hypothetical protein
MESGTTTKSSSAPADKSALKKWAPLLIIVAMGGGIAGGIAGGLSGGGGMVKGTWLSNWGSYITVTSTTWYSVTSYGTSVYAIETLSNSQCIMQNPADDAYNPSKWTKNEYHATDDGWAFCSSVYNAETAAAAADTDTSAIYDSTAASGGCNGFDHTLVTAYAMPIAGSWNDNWGGSMTITADEYKSGDSTYQIEAYGANFILMQNPADDAYNPSKWTKMEFHTVGSGFGFCMSVYNGDTATSALMTATIGTTYIAANATHGCNGFPHSIASPA